MSGWVWDNHNEEREDHDNNDRLGFDKVWMMTVLMMDVAD